MNKKYLIISQQFDDNYNTIIFIVLCNKEQRPLLDIKYNNGGHLLYVGETLNLISDANERRNIIDYIDKNLIQ